MTDLIYCANGNKAFARIAISAGFVYGARLPHTIHYSPRFVDQEYKNPDRRKYMDCLQEYRPDIATVLDWQYPEQLDEVLDWASEASEFVKTIIVIPKVRGKLFRLPQNINGIPVRLGFSYPTGYGEADFDILSEMIGWPGGIHILGGPPQAILAIRSGRFKARKRSTSKQADFFIQALDIRSVDCNYHLGLANKGLVWQGNATGTIFRHISLREINNGKRWGDGTNRSGANYEAFRQSCKNIMKAWNDE